MEKKIVKKKKIIQRTVKTVKKEVDVKTEQVLLRFYKNNGLYKNILKNDFEEQPGNLTMLNSNHPELINMSSNTTVSDVYKNPRFSNDNKMNTSVNLPNSDKVSINLKNSLQNKQRNSNIILTRNSNNNALYIKDNSEEEIKSIKEKKRKNY